MAKNWGLQVRAYQRRPEFGSSDGACEQPRHRPRLPLALTFPFVDGLLWLLIRAFRRTVDTHGQKQGTLTYFEVPASFDDPYLPLTMIRGPWEGPVWTETLAKRSVRDLVNL